VRGDKQVVGYAADELPRLGEFHECVLAAVEDVNVPLGIHSDSGGFHEVFARRQVEKIRNYLIIKSWWG